MAALPGAYDFHIKRPGPWTETLTWSIDDTPVNLSGYTITLRLKALDATTSVNCTGTSQGVITWTVSAQTIAALNGFITYDICAYSGDGTPNWLLAGTLEVTA